MIILAALALLSPLASPQVAGSDEPTQETLGGVFTTPVTPPLTGGVIDGRLLEITMNIPGQTWQERFVLGIPGNMQTPAPVLTLFHGYGEEPVNVVQNSTIAQEAMARGWLVFIPLGAHQYNYGIDYAQENIELAFEFVGSRLPIDMDRIYGVGFSMGGGAAASYAARHLDPAGIQFAAVVNHTGTTSLRATYQTSNDFNLFRSPLMFGGTPDESTFRYSRSSTVDMDAIAGTVNPRAALSSNLSHIPVQHWYATMDANASIIDQTIELDQAMEQIGADTDLIPRSFSIHSWTTLDNQAVLDWLESKRLTRPTAGDITRTIADRDGAWHDLQITQAQAEELTPILWTVQPQANAFYALEMENLAEVAVDAETIGLNTDASMLLVLETRDSTPTDIVLHGINQAPAAVVRRGRGASAWSYDAANRTLTMSELSGTPGWASWRIQP